MSDDGDEFDPSSAAAVALGEQADGDLDLSDGDASDPDATRPDDGDAPDTDSGDETSASGGDSAVATFLLPLFVADEAGPTAPTLQEQAGLSERIAYILDGGLDYVLHFSDELGERLEDSLGPAGKFGRAASGLFDDAGDQGDDGAGESGHQQSSDDGDDVDVGPDGVGDL